MGGSLVRFWAGLSENKMASGKAVLDDKDKIARQLAQNLRNDFHLLSNEAKKKYPSVKEVRMHLM